jgi:hypothetical protein
LGVAASTSTVAVTSTSTNPKKGLIVRAGLLSSELGSDFSATNTGKGLERNPNRATFVASAMLMEKTMAVAEIATSEEQNAGSKALAKVATDGVVMLATWELIGAALPAAAFALDAYDAKLKYMDEPR